MKKFATIVIFMLLNVFIFGNTYKYYEGVGYDKHVPKCYAIACPKCKENRMIGCEQGIATRHRHQYVTDEKTGNKFIEYICDHGHVILICYDGPDFKGNK